MNPLLHQPPFRDEEYIRMIRTGGTEAEIAIRSLYLHYRTSVRSSFIKLIHRYPEYRGQPEDLLHDSFLLLLHKIEFEHTEIQSLASFWRGLGRNLLLNQLKKDDRTILVSEPEEVYGAMVNFSSHDAMDKESREDLAYSFSLLGPKCRDILLMWMDRFTMTEIATRLNMTNVGMVRKLKYTCFKKLKEIVRSGNKTPGSGHLPYE